MITAMVRMVIGFIGAGLLVDAALAAEPGSVAEGRRYVEAFCSDCHAVTKADRPSPLPAATEFAAIAQRPRTTGLSLAAWLTGPHIDMPNFIVPEWQRQNVIAYILSLTDR